MARKTRNPLSSHPNAVNLINQWHPTLNGELTPETIGAGSSKVVWWLGECGHEWDAKLFTRTKLKQNCPYCSGKRVLVGFNDLATTQPDLARQWHPILNKDTPLEAASAGQTTKVWWLGECGHEWKAVIQSRTRGSGCPYCANTLVLAGFNDLASHSDYDHIIAEWHPDNDLTPQDVTVRSTKKVKWICSVKDSHEWVASVSNRTRMNSGCPDCYKENPKLVGANKKAISESHLIEEWDPENNLDPTQVTLGSGRDVSWVCSQNANHVWLAKVSNRARGSGCPYCSGYKVLAGDNDLASSEYSHLVNQWHPDNALSPQEVTVGTDEVIKWLCNKGHSWNVSVYKRTKGNYGCPICSGRSGVNGQMVSNFPELLDQWSESNKEDPSDIPHQSTRIFTWKCAIDSRHIWEASPASRYGKKSCPVCAGRVVIVGVNDLTSFAQFSHLLNEWHHDNKHSPQDVTSGSNVRTKWLCSKNSNHTWTSTVYSRISGASNCPSCAAATRGVSKGEDELYSILTKLGFADTQRSMRSLIPRRELDLYIPSLKFAVEFNGVYWHSDAVRPDPNYHADKLRKCQAAGIRLFQVWEDDWESRRDVVIRGLAHRLNKTHLLPDLLPHLPDYYFEKVGARKLTTVEVSYAEAAGFLEAHHIQGKATGTHYFGLQDSQERLRAVLVARRTGREGEWSIERYATAGVVPGGFTKLLTHAERTIEPERWVTFADLTVSDGNLYESNGFVEDTARRLKPDYSYLYEGRRVHKFNFRLKRFRDDPLFLYDPEMSESELAELNGLPRVWDAGKIRYVKVLGKAEAVS